MKINAHKKRNTFTNYLNIPISGLQMIDDELDERVTALEENGRGR